MALGFSSFQRLERLLLKTRKILGEDDPVFNENNKIQALQFAAVFYNLYGGDGSETTYTDLASLTIIQSEMIATKAAKELTLSAISYYKDDVVTANGGPASVTFRNDKLAWLKELLASLEDKLKELEQKEGVDAEASLAFGVPGLVLHKVRACQDPPDDVCTDC